MDTSELLQIVSDVFAAKADHHEMEIVAAYFADRPDLLRDLHESKHEVVLGRRGTGKTMVLKHLSFDSQLHRSSNSVSANEFSIDFIGFYVSLGVEDQPKVGPENDRKLESVYEHWFNLLTLISVLNVLEVLRANPRLSDQSIERWVTEISTNLFGQIFTDLSTFREWIGQEEKNIRECCGWEPEESVAKITDYTKNLSKITSVRSFHSTLTSSLAKLLAPIFRREPRFYYLLDRFDEVCPDRQKVIQHIIQIRQGQAYYVKLGVLHATKIHLTGITNQDYRILNIEQDVNSPRYTEFCLKVLEKRFAAITEILRRDNPNSPFLSLFAKPGQMFPGFLFVEQAKGIVQSSQRQGEFWDEQPDSEIGAFRKLLNSGEVPLFSGIQEIAALSSGCIRIFIEITYRVIRDALDHDPELLIAEQCIPPDVQHKAIAIETDQRFSQELKTSISATTADVTIQKATHNLLDSLLKRFAKSLLTGEPAIHVFQVNGELSPQNDDELVLEEAMLVLDRLGLVTKRTPDFGFSRRGDKYAVSRTFDPKYGLPPIEFGCIEMTVEELYRASNPHWQGASKKELPLAEPLGCFYATGFRSEWENALRDRFRDTVFPKHNLNYSDGADEHSRSQQIGLAVHSLMSNVHFLIADISDYNENVCFEMGLCVALELWCYRIKNTLHIAPTTDQRIVKMLESLKYEKYKLKPVKSQSELAAVDFESVEKVVGDIAAKFRKLPEDKRKAVNPFDNTHGLNLIRGPSTPTVFLFADKTETMFTWIKDYGKLIRDDLGVMFRDDQGSSYKGQEALKYLETIARSTHCVIDITNKNRFSAFLLGYAVGRGKHHLAVWRRGTDGLITNYRGDAGQQDYETKDELWLVIRNFVQAPH